LTSIDKLQEEDKRNPSWKHAVHDVMV
jgi:hypothetical protein